MPPALSDEENSEPGDLAVPLPTKRDEDMEDDDDMPGIIKGDVNGHVDDEKELEAEREAEDDEDDEDDDEDMGEDEFVVEKIVGHAVVDGMIKYKVKWEGYEKKSDQTWEDEENLETNADEILGEYLKSVGGREKILEESQKAVKTKKRGRPTGGDSNSSSKRSRRNGSHPASATPPASAAKEWKPPAGSWEDHIETLEACQDADTGKLVVYLTWKNGQKTQHDTKVIYARCPQKMLHFYEQHVKIVKTTDEFEGEKS